MDTTQVEKARPAILISRRKGLWEISSSIEAGRCTTTTVNFKTMLKCVKEAATRIWQEEK